MLGGPLTLFHKRSHENHSSSLPSSTSSAVLQTEQHNIGSGGALAGDEPLWLQPFLQHMKTADNNARKMLMHVRRDTTQPRRCKPQNAAPCSDQYGGQRPCFASISASQKNDPPKQEHLKELKESAEQLGEDLRVPVPETSVPGIGDVRSLALKQLLCGTIAGAVSSFAVSPFQVLRTRVIAGRGGSSAAEVLGTVVHTEKGLESLMKGSLKITLLATSIQKGVQFAVYEAIKRTEQEKMGKDPKWVPGVTRKVPGSTVAGATAGLASTLLVYPFNTMMDRLLLQPSVYSSIWGSMGKVIKESGFSELYRGIIPALITMVPEAAASFYTYETVKNRLEEAAERDHKRSKNFLGMSAVSIGAGAAAGLVAATLTYPLEVARKQINMSVLPQGTVGIGGAMTYNSLPQALVGIAQREGLGGFYRGFVVQALQVVPMTAISFAVYELAKRTFVAEHEERRDEIKG